MNEIHRPGVSADPISLCDHKYRQTISDFWNVPATITANNFVYKSLSNWAFNVAVGCSHACRFCYVPSASANKQAPKLAKYGVEDPDEQWGDYVLLRPWDEKAFLRSLLKAEATPADGLKPDGKWRVTRSTRPKAISHTFVKCM